MPIAFKCLENEFFWMWFVQCILSRHLIVYTAQIMHATNVDFVIVAVYRVYAGHETVLL